CRQARGHQEARVAPHAASQLGHAPTGKWHRSTHDSDVDGSCRPASYEHLSAPVPPSLASGRESGGDPAGFQTRYGETIQKKKAGSVNRPAVEVADILRAQGDDYIDRHQDRIRFQQLKVMSAIVRCRTAALGGHIDTCPQCGGDRTISYNSCRN